MEINKKRLKKVSRKFRILASSVINAYYQEQNDLLNELMTFVNNTPIIFDYIQSLQYNLDDLETTINQVYSTYGRRNLDLGVDSRKRTYLLYRVFEYIVEKNLDTYQFGWYYSSGTKYQDMAKAFGDRLIYPFVNNIEEYIKDISIDMGYDEEISHNININSSGVQLNIANHNSTINAEQTNDLDLDEINRVILEVEELINGIEDREAQAILIDNLELIKNEVKEDQPKRISLKSTVKTMSYIASSIALVPDLTSGINMLASLFKI